MLFLFLLVVVIEWDPQRPSMEMGDSSSRFKAREDGVDLCCVRG